MIPKRFVHIAEKDLPNRHEPGARKRSQFKAGWGRTLDKLDEEIAKLGGHDIVVQAGYRNDQIRNDGWPYGKAVPLHPGVVVTFYDRKNRPLSFPCDTYATIDDNMRAIALSLEALRAVDRYGVTRRDEQYMGFKAIEAPRAMSVEDAAQALSAQAPSVSPDVIIDSASWYRTAYRQAAKRLHPDVQGNEHLWRELGKWKELLDAHHGLKAEQVAR